MHKLNSAAIKRILRKKIKVEVWRVDDRRLFFLLLSCSFHFPCSSICNAKSLDGGWVVMEEVVLGITTCTRPSTKGSGAKWNGIARLGRELKEKRGITERGDERAVAWWFNLNRNKCDKCLDMGSSVVHLRKRGNGRRAAAQQLQLPLCCLLSPLPWPCPSSTRLCSHPGLPAPLCCCLFSCPVGHNLLNSFDVRDVTWCCRMPSVPRREDESPFTQQFQGKICYEWLWVWAWLLQMSVTCNS